MHDDLNEQSTKRAKKTAQVSQNSARTSLLLAIRHYGPTNGQLGHHGSWDGVEDDALLLGFSVLLEYFLFEFYPQSYEAVLHIDFP